MKKLSDYTEKEIEEFQGIGQLQDALNERCALGKSVSSDDLNIPEALYRRACEYFELKLEEKVG